jgi:hypothetical protein
MIHGDNDAMNHTASDGCIALTHAYRGIMQADGDNRLQVIE